MKINTGGVRLPASNAWVCCSIFPQPRTTFCISSIIRCSHFIFMLLIILLVFIHLVILLVDLVGFEPTNLIRAMDVRSQLR